MHANHYFLFLLFSIGSLRIQAQEGDSQPMNVLFIVSDDLNTSGLERAATPHLDRLADMSMTFNRAYCQYPVCAPSRNSFLSGLYPGEIGAKWAPLRDLAPDVTTMPQLFRENGFYTASIGKIFHIDNWDARWPDEGWEYDDPKAWDYRINCPPANQGARRMPPFPRKGIKLTWPGHDGPIDYGMISFESDLAQDDGQATQEAIRQLDMHLDRPFFLAVGYRRPHAPFVAPKAYFWPYPLESMALPDPGDRSDVPEEAFTVTPPNYGDPEAMKKMKMCYLASISFLDAQVGRLLESLEEHGMMENTIIIFLSDHGFQLGEHGEWHKNTLFEESAKVPLMIRIPGVTRPGARSLMPVELIDIFPTLQAYFKLPQPHQVLSGKSLLPWLENPDLTWEKKDAITEVVRRRDNRVEAHGYSIRIEEVRYTEWWSPEKGLIGSELYDLEKDPASEVNQTKNPDYEGLKISLSDRMNQYRKQVVP